MKSHVRCIALTGVLSGLWLGPVFAVTLSDLTNHDAARGMKGALAESMAFAVHGCLRVTTPVECLANDYEVFW